MIRALICSGEQDGTSRARSLGRPIGSSACSHPLALDGPASRRRWERRRVQWTPETRAHALPATVSPIARRRRRSRAARAEAPDRDAELAGFVGEVFLDARCRELDHADRQDLQHLVVALEGCGLGVTGPVGLESRICVTLRVSAQRAAMRSAPVGELPCRSTMSGCLARTWSSLAQMR